MGSWDKDTLTEPQRRGFASVREELERERLTAAIDLASPDAVDTAVRGLLQRAWARS